MVYIIVAVVLATFWVSLIVTSIVFPERIIAWHARMFYRADVKVFDTWCKNLRAKMAAEFDKLGGTSWVAKYMPQLLRNDVFLKSCRDAASRLEQFSRTTLVRVHLEILNQNNLGTLWRLRITFVAPREVDGWTSFYKVDVCIVIVRDNHDTYALFLRDGHKNFQTTISKKGFSNPIKKAIASTYGVREGQYNLIART